MLSPRWRFVKNAAANLASGAGAAVLAVALPPFLVKWLTPTMYGAWLLLLQLAAYTALLRFGIESVLGRWVAVALAEGRTLDRDRAASNAVLLLGAGTLLSFAGVGVVAWHLGAWFHKFPAYLLPDARAALVIVGGTLALGLPLSALNGVFAGYQRYEISGLLNLGGKCVIAAAVLAAAHSAHPTLALLAIAWAAGSGLQYLAAIACWRRFVPELRIHPRLIQLHRIRELWSECAALSLWNVGMLMISGLDVVLVGYFDFRRVAYYALATNLVALISGASYAIFTSLIPTSADLSVRPDGAAVLERLLLRSSRFNTLLLMGSGMPLLLLTQPLLRLWVGVSYAQATGVLLQLLVLGNMIRLIEVPYALLLVGTGQQRMVILTPILEGVVNLAFSIVLGMRIGAIGVALGTLIGAVFGTACHLGINMPRTFRIRYSFRRFVRQAIWRPLLPFVPALGLAGLAWAWGPRPGFLWCIPAIVVAAGGLLWRFSLDAGERAHLRWPSGAHKAASQIC